MARTVHAEGLRERQNMRDAPTGRTLGGTTFTHECRICGADHGTERHTKCPECGLRPNDFDPRVQEHVTWEEKRRLPFRVGTCWSSKRIKALD